jgi:transposase
MSNFDPIDTPAAAEYATVHLVFELSKAKWKLGLMLPGAEKPGIYTIDGGDLKALAGHLAAARAKAARSGKPVRILSCYEAGLDGHWLHRWLTKQGVISYVVDPSSIEVNRRARRAKTDRIDVNKLMRTFLAYLRGEPQACSMLHVPSVEDEDRKRRTRERDRLQKERNAHSNRIKGLLFGQGIREVMPLKGGFISTLETMRTGDDRELPPRLKQEIVREHERLMLVHNQLVALEATSTAELRHAPRGSPAAKINLLVDLKSIGQISAQPLVNEVFYRSFDNRRQVGAYFGLTGTPYNSGTISREQGISKAGNGRARKVAVELAWLWLRHQPESELSRWFRQRVGDQKGRVRRIAIVALARKLMVALWRYLTTGVLPNGAVQRASF